MKMRRIVLIDIHVDDNPIKTAYLRHISLLLRLVGYKYTIIYLKHNPKAAKPTEQD